MADKIAPGVTRDGPSRVPIQIAPSLEEEELAKRRERWQGLLWLGLGIGIVANLVLGRFYPDIVRPVSLAGFGLALFAFLGLMSANIRLARMERERLGAQGDEAIAEQARQKRDNSRWYAVVGVMMLFASGLSAALGVGGVLMVLYGTVAYLWWNRKAKQAYDPWKDEELDAWEREEFGP